jgi:hypothetical protein
MLVLSVALGATSALAQQKAAASAAPAATDVAGAGNQFEGLRLDAPESRVRVEDLQAAQPDKVKLKKHFVLTGPLVHAFNVKKVAEVPKRLLHLVNPFGKAELGEETQHEVDGLDTRSWSTVVGWHPGASAFPDATTQEPVGLFSAGW